MSQLQVTGEAKIRDIQGPVVANSGVITALDGAASQYVRGDGTLADFPTSTGGGSSVSYYLNSSVSQGTIGGVAYRELNKEPIIGAGTDITISANGYVASYITDANDPDVLSVPGGNFNCEFYFSVNSDAHNPTFYAELYKYDGTTFTLLGSSQAVPESINQGTTIAPYYFAIPVATAALALTDRLAIRIYVNVDTRTVTLHTENSHLCQVVTTFSKGMVSLNNLTDQSQFITTGTSGTDFNIVSTGDTHTFNLPVASATNTGKLSSTDWSTFNNKQNALTLTTTGTSGAATLVGATLNIPQYQGVLTNPVTGTGTTNTLPKFTGTSAIGNSNITDTGSLITLGSNTTISNGGLGIGTTSLSNVNLYIAKNITGGTSAFGVVTDGIIQSDVTANAFYYRTDSRTAAASFLLSNLVHYQATQGTFGAGSTVGTQAGFRVTSNVTGATNNYAFWGQIPSGTNRWNLYMDGTADNYLAGSLGIGTTSLTGITLNIAKNLTGATASTQVFAQPIIQSDVTGTAVIYNAFPSTQAAAFTLNNLYYYQANQSTIGATSAVTTQIGFRVASSLTGATNNFAFRSELAAATNVWNLYMNGTAANYLNGSLGIGTTSINAKLESALSTSNGVSVSLRITNSASASATPGQGVQMDFVNDNGFNSSVSSSAIRSITTSTANGGTDLLFLNYNGTSLTEYMRITRLGSVGIGSTSLTGYNLRVSKSLTGSVSTTGIQSGGVIQSDVTSDAQYFSSSASTAAASFTVTDLAHFIANQGTFGAGSTVTKQYGFRVAGGLTGATNNYAFFSDIAAAANRWNLYMNGTANNYMAGSLGIGATGLNGYNLRVSRNITGNLDTYGIMSDGQIQSDVTTSTDYFRTNASTQAAAFTLFLLNHYNAGQGTFGASSSVTSQCGFSVSANLIGATNNFGFRGQIPAGTNRWNLFMDGTANNYMAGNLGIGSTSVDSIMLRISRSFTSTLTGGILLDGQISSTGTGQTNYLQTTASTAAAAFTAASIRHINIQQGTFGAGSTVTNQFGVFVGANMIGATSNYGFFGDIPSGTNRWNLYMAGTAANYLAGTLSIGTTTSTRTVDILGAAGVNTVLKLEGGSSSTQTYLQLAYNGATNAQSGYIGYDTSSNLILYTANTERLRVNSVGLNIGGNASNNASAKLQVDSTTQGFLPPRMTAAQRAAIATPAEGLIVVQTDGTAGLYMYIGATWRTLAMV